MKILYLGLDPTRYLQSWKGSIDLTHLPLIETSPRPFKEIEPYFLDLSHSTHVILTSRSAAFYFCRYAREVGSPIGHKSFLAIGPATAAALHHEGCPSTTIAPYATAEGVVACLDRLSPPCHIFYPHSSIARCIISDYLMHKHLPCTIFPLYDTVARPVVLPDLEPFDKIVFTSPSTVTAFFALAQLIPHQKKCEAIGPITQEALDRHYQKFL